MPGECRCFTIQHKNELSCITNAMPGCGLTGVHHDTQGTGLVVNVVGKSGVRQRIGRRQFHD